ncbi:MAG: hypothetical protein AOA65_1437 [Candidatus Bathyarchaeota archaeon BA1]|nr:MAG: hypothetical protein AOA65_1437 [Candidatus Bathyarchaeota archaeon BA1]
MGFANNSLQAELAMGSTLMGFVKGMLGFEWMFQTCALVIVPGSTLIFMLTKKKAQCGQRGKNVVSVGIGRLNQA